MSRLYPIRSPYVQAVSKMNLGPFLAIPRAFFHHPALQNARGKPNLVAIEVLAMLLSWYQPQWVEELDEDGHPRLQAYQRFPGVVFRINYKAWARWLFDDPERVQPIKRAVAFLRSRGLVEVQVHPMQDPQGRLVGNAVYLAPNVALLADILDVRHYASPEDLFEADASEPDATAEQDTAAHDAQTEGEGEGDEAPSRQERRDGASFLAPPSRKNRSPSRKNRSPSRQKRRDFNKESLSTKPPKDQEEPTPPPPREGGVGGGDNSPSQKLFQRLGVPQKYRAHLVQALTDGHITWHDVAAEWARVYASEGLRRPAAAAAANLVRGNLPEPEWYEPARWQNLPAAVRQALATAWPEGRESLEALNVQQPSYPQQEQAQMQAELEALAARLLGGEA